MKNSKIMLTFLLVLLMSACSSETKPREVAAKIEDAGSAPQETVTLINGVTRAVAHNDSTAFAKLVDYPLSRPYPLHDIGDEAAMRRYFPTIADDSLREILAGPEALTWRSYGWRGWSPDDGQYIWIDEKVTEIPYLSNAEKSLRDSLVSREMASLAPSLRGQWTPDACFTDSTGRVYRIDADKEGRKYRLSIYNSRADMRRRPAMVMTGTKNIEGSIGFATYDFSGPKGVKAVYVPWTPDGEPASVALTLPDDTTYISEATAAYWLDLLP